MLRELNKDMTGRIKTLNFQHMVPMFKPAWEHAFTLDRNLQGWVKEGVLPFTRRQLWELQENNKATTALSNTAPEVRDLQQHSSQQPVSDRQSATARPQEARQQQAAGDQGHLPQDLADAVRSAKLQRDKLGSLSVLATLPKEQLIQHIMSLTEAMDGVTTAAYNNDRDGDGSEEEEEGLEAFPGRITARNLWGLEGSVTGGEAMRIARGRAEERKQQELEKAAKAADRDAKRRQAVAQAVCRAAELLDIIKQGGEATIATLNVKDLQSLIQSNDPTAQAPKGNKKDLLLLTRDLPEVKRAVETYKATRGAAPLHPPPQPPMPQLPLQPLPPPPLAPNSYDSPKLDANGFVESVGSCPCPNTSQGSPSGEHPAE